MRYLIVILSLFVSIIANSQVTDTQLRVRADQNPDSILVMSNDTNSSSAYYRTGKWRKLSDLIGSVAGDTDWWKLGGTSIPTNSDSAYRSGYTLFKGLYGGLQTKIEMLKDGVLQFDIADGITDQNFIRFKPLQDGARNVDFLMSTTTTAFSGSRNDNVFYWGWNLGAGGGVVESGKGAIGLSMEDFYNPSGTNAYSEFHLIHYDTLGVSRRPMTFLLDVGSTSTWAMALSLAQIKYTLATDVTKIGFDFTMPSGNLALFKMLNPQTGLGVEMQVNDASNEFQITNTMGGGSEIYLNSFTYCETNILRRAASFGSTATTIAGNDGSGWFTNVGTGWGIDLTSGNLVVDSSQVATQYDLTTVSGGATDLSIAQSGGTQVIQSSTGTDVGIRNLYGLLITEGATDTLHFRVDSSLFATTYDLTQIPISSLKAAAATNTINNANYAQEWQWNTLAGATGLKLSSTSTAAASNLHKLFEISTTGANGTSGQSTYGGYFSNTHSGTTSTNYGLYSVATGAASANYGVYGTSNSSGVTGNVGAGVSGRNSNGGIALEGITTSGGVGVYAESPDGYSVYSNTTNGTAGAFRHNWSGNTDYGAQLDIIRNTSNGSNGAAGIGGGINFMAETSTGATSTTNQIKSIWTTATNASRTSSMIFTGVNSATEGDILTLKGSKQLQFHGYGTGGAFTASPVADLFVDATGNVVQGSMTGQSWTADADDATTPVVVSNQTLAFRGNRGIDTDLIDGVVDSISYELDFSELATVTTIETDDAFALWDAGGLEEKITYANLITDIISDVGGSGDGNGIYDGSGTVPTATVATLTDNLTFSATAGEADLYIDGTNDNIGIGTNSPEEQLTISNEDSNLSYPIMAFHTDQTGSSTSNIGRTNYLYGAEALVAVSAAKVTSTTSNDAVFNIDMLNSGGTTAEALDFRIKDTYTVNKPRLSLFGAMQNSRVDSVGTSITLDESYYAVRCTTATIIITLPNANTTNNEWIGTQYWIYNDSGGNVTINPNGTNDTVNGSNADITLADNAGYYLMLMSTTAGAVNNWMGLKTP